MYKVVVSLDEKVSGGREYCIPLEYCIRVPLRINYSTLSWAIINNSSWSTQRNKYELIRIQDRNENFGNQTAFYSIC